ncbi:MAG: DUF72 domain-containing protein [Betaproteobacteria bacterium]|nr:DUF72 domain-containing protein [Betaproteobacteria bacterium]
MTGQLDLFGEGAPSLTAPVASPAQVLPALFDEATVALGRALPTRLHLGTSSWTFPGWAGIVYRESLPEPVLSREGLRAYSAHPVLNSAGIDRTFYAPVPASEFARYAAQVPESFRFVVKAPALVTDAFIRGAGGKPAGESPRFLDAAFAAAHFVEPCVDGLGAKAGPLVFQFSPLGRSIVRDPDRFAARLHGFLDALPAGPLYAVELRDAGLLGAPLAAALGAARARYCFGVHSRMPDIAGQAAALAGLFPGPLVARWNLHAGYAYQAAKTRYAPFNRLVDEDPRTRSALAECCLEALSGGHPAFVIANNKAEGSAPLTLVKLAHEVVDGVSARTPR